MNSWKQPAHVRSSFDSAATAGLFWNVFSVLPQLMTPYPTIARSKLSIRLLTGRSTPKLICRMWCFLNSKSVPSVCHKRSSDSSALCVRATGCSFAICTARSNSGRSHSCRTQCSRSFFNVCGRRGLSSRVKKRHLRTESGFETNMWTCCVRTSAHN